MKYLKIIVCGDDKEQLAKQLSFLLDSIREGATVGWGYMSKDLGPSWYRVKEGEVTRGMIIPASVKLVLEVNVRGEQTGQLAQGCEEVLRGVKMGCCGGFGAIADGSWNYIIRDREKGELAPEDFLRDDRGQCNEPDLEIDPTYRKKLFDFTMQRYAKENHDE